MESNTMLHVRGERYFIFSTYMRGDVTWSIYKSVGKQEWEILAEDLTEQQADGMIKLLGS